MAPKVLTEARKLASLGLFPHGLLPNSKKPAGFPGTRGFGWGKIAREDWEKTIAEDCNLGMRVGKQGGIIVWDIDTWDKKNNRPVAEAVNLFKEVIAEFPEILQNPWAKTASGGYHVYFPYDPEFGFATLKVNGVDVGEFRTGTNGCSIACYPTEAPDKRTGEKYLGKYTWKVHPADVGPPENWLPVPAGLMKKFLDMGVRKHGPTEKRKASIFDFNAIEVAGHCLTHISPDDYNTWIKVGFSLKSIDDGECGYQLWDSWSENSEGYCGSDKTSYKWDTFDPKPDGKGEYTLRDMAKKNNPEAYATAMARMAKEAQKDINNLVLKQMHREVVGLATIFDDQCGDDLVLVGKNTYFWYNKKKALWRQVKKSVAEQHIVFELDRIFDKVHAWVSTQRSDEDDKDKKEEWAKTRKQLTRIQKEIQRTRCARDILRRLEYTHYEKDLDFMSKADSNRHLLSCANGVVELSTGIIRDRRRDDYFTYEIPTEFYDDADCKEINSWISELMLGDDEMVRYMQKLMGYAITGEMSEQLFVVFTGTTRNGKGSFLRTLSSVCGLNIVATVKPAVFMCKRNSGGCTPELARMQGKRVVVLTEGSSSDSFDVRLLKEVTGSDDISANPKGRDSFQFSPQFIPIMQTNEIPKIPDVDNAVRRRIVRVPFDVEYRFANDSVDPYNADNPKHRLADGGKYEKLLTGKPEMRQAFLAWLVQGAKSWYDAPDLCQNKPARAKAATEEYFKAQDLAGQFITECLEREDRHKTTNAELLETLSKWVRETGNNLSSGKMFKALVRTGFKKVRTNKSRGYAGIKIRIFSDEKTDTPVGRMLMAKNKCQGDT